MLSGLIWRLGSLHSDQQPEGDREAELLRDAFQPPLRGGPAELLG